MAAERWPLQLGNKNGIKQTVRVRNKGTQGLYVKQTASIISSTMSFGADVFRCYYETSERQRGGSEQPRDLIRKQSRGCVFPLNNRWA